uniref:Uncharacterized protein n=1 Tax=Haptolina ericina TaxID=156174 RepID=A0A7S3FC38_9EUKA
MSGCSSLMVGFIGLQRAELAIDPHLTPRRPPTPHHSSLGDFGRRYPTDWPPWLAFSMFNTICFDHLVATWPRRKLSGSHRASLDESAVYALRESDACDSLKAAGNKSSTAVEELEVGWTMLEEVNSRLEVQVAFTDVVVWEHGVMERTPGNWHMPQCFHNPEWNPQLTASCWHKTCMAIEFEGMPWEAPQCTPDPSRVMREASAVIYLHISGHHDSP